MIWDFHKVLAVYVCGSDYWKWMSFSDEPNKFTMKRWARNVWTSSFSSFLVATRLSVYQSLDPLKTHYHNTTTLQVIDFVSGPEEYRWQSLTPVCSYNSVPLFIDQLDRRLNNLVRNLLIKRVLSGNNNDFMRRVYLQYLGVLVVGI